MLKASLRHADQTRPSEDPGTLPTYGNILSSLERIATEAAAGSFVYIHFTGHGTTIESGTPTAAAEMALVVLAGDDGAEIRYLRGTEFARSLRMLVDKKLKVTVVLDCCVSWSVVRGKLDPSIKSLPYDAAVDRAYPPAQALEEEGLSQDAVYRQASSRSNWLLDPDGYVVLAACGPAETAREIEVGKGNFYGALSYFLIRTFLRRGSVGGKHQYIYSHVVARFWEKCPEQNPILYGNKSLGFFSAGAPAAAWRAASIPVVNVKARGTDSSSLRLGVGLAHGVSVGDVFAINVNPAMDPTGASASSLLMARTAEVYPLTSKLEPLDPATDTDTGKGKGKGTALPLPTASGLTATEVTRLSLCQIPAGIADLRPNQDPAAWTNRSASLNIRSLDLKGTGDDSDYTSTATPHADDDDDVDANALSPEFSLIVILTSDQIMIQDSWGTVSTIEVNLPAAMTIQGHEEHEEHEAWAEFVLDVVEHMRRFHAVRQLFNTQLSYFENPITKQFNVALVGDNQLFYCSPTTRDLQSSVSPGYTSPKSYRHHLGVAQVQDGDSLELIVQNWGPTALYVNVLSLNGRGEIEDLLHASYGVIPPCFGVRDPETWAANFKNQYYGQWRLQIREFIPDWVGPDEEWCRDYLKVCITSQPTSLAVLEQPHVGEFVGLRRDTDRQHRAGGEQADAAGVPIPENWVMFTFRVDTRRVHAQNGNDIIRYTSDAWTE